MRKIIGFLCAAVVALGASSVAQADVVAYFEDFDGNTNGYNVSSTTALVGDSDWVDFNNRIVASDIGTMVEGYTTASTGQTVLAGSSNGNDPQIRSDFGFGIDKTTVTQFQLRLRVDKDDDGVFNSALDVDDLANGDFDLFWGSTQYVNPGAGNVGDTNFNLGNATTLVEQSDGWHLATWDIVGGLTAGANPTIESVRIDPANGPAGNGNSFEIDYLSISTAVPEPSSMALLGLGMAGIAFRRRRR